MVKKWVTGLFTLSKYFLTTRTMSNNEVPQHIKYQIEDLEDQNEKLQAELDELRSNSKDKLDGLTKTVKMLQKEVETLLDDFIEAVAKQ